MRLALLKEVKSYEGRVALKPSDVRELVKSGVDVWVEKNAGLISGFENLAYQKAGARIVSSKDALIKKSDLILKVKEPTLDELDMMAPGQIFFSYLHLAAIPKTLKKMLQKKVTGLAFETLEDSKGRLPLLKPMSEIAGKLATEKGAHFLHRDQGGAGVLLSGVDGKNKGHVLVLGGGVVGQHALDIAIGLGAECVLLELNAQRRKVLTRKYKNKARLLESSRRILKQQLKKADLVIGAVLVPGGKAPIVVKKEDLALMKKGSVIVDVAIDQGGCIETSVLTSHARPIKVIQGIQHYAVPNMPAAVPVTGTYALSEAIFPYVKKLCTKGLDQCLKIRSFKTALNVTNGKITHPGLNDIV